MSGWGGRAAGVGLSGWAVWPRGVCEVQEAGGGTCQKPWGQCSVRAEAWHLSREQRAIQTEDAASCLADRGRCGVVPQETWLRNGTLRENILAGRDFDADASPALAEFCTVSLVCTFTCASESQQEDPLPLAGWWRRQTCRIICCSVNS